MKIYAGQTQGCADAQIVMALVLLNMTGDDCVDNLRTLEGNEGFEIAIQQDFIFSKGNFDERKLL